MRKIFAVLLLVIPMSAFSSQEKTSLTDHPLDAAELHNFLIQSLPDYEGADRFFDLAGREGGLRTYYSAIIQNDSDLLKIAKDGRDFQSKYHTWAQTAFGSDLSLGVSPLREVLRRFEQVIPQIKHQVLREMPEVQAARLAWQDTLSTFSYPPTTTHSELDARKHEDEVALQALYYYRKRYHRLMASDVVATELKFPSVESLKRQFVSQILELRKKHFFSHLDMLQGRFKSPLTLRLPDGRQYEASVQELRQAGIEWLLTQPVKAQLSDLKIKGSGQVPGAEIAVNVLDWYLSRTPKVGEKRDWNAAQAYYVRKNRKPSYPIYGLRLSLPGKEPFVISESDFSLLLGQLVLPGSKNLFRGNHWENQFIYEAASRDAILADAAAFLRAKIDRNHDFFSARIQAKLSKESSQRDYMNRSFAERLNLDPQLLSRNDEVAGLEVSGLAIHPNHWLIRDEFAIAAERAGFERQDRADHTNWEDQDIKEIQKDFLGAKNKIKQASKAVAKEKRHSRLRQTTANIRRVAMISVLGAALLKGHCKWCRHSTF